MQRNAIIKRSLRQQGIKRKDRKLIVYAFEQQYDQLLQYAEAYGKTPVLNNLHYEILLTPALKEIGYEVRVIDGEKFMVRN